MSTPRPRCLQVRQQRQLEVGAPARSQPARRRHPLRGEVQRRRQRGMAATAPRRGRPHRGERVRGPRRCARQDPVGGEHRRRHPDGPAGGGEHQHPGRRGVSLDRGRIQRAILRMGRHLTSCAAGLGERDPDGEQVAGDPDASAQPGGRERLPSPPLPFDTDIGSSVAGRAGRNEKSDARALRHQSTVPVEALHHHVDLQAHRHHRGKGVDHDEPTQSVPPRTRPATANGAESSLTMVSLEDGAVLLTCGFSCGRYWV